MASMAFKLRLELVMYIRDIVYFHSKVSANIGPRKDRNDLYRMALFHIKDCCRDTMKVHKIM